MSADHQQAAVPTQPAQQEQADPMAWALRLKRLHEAGRTLTPFQIQSYREALGLDGRQSWQ